MLSALPGDIRTLLSKESTMPILPSMNTFIELRQEEDYRNIFQESTGLISQVLHTGARSNLRYYIDARSF